MKALNRDVFAQEKNFMSHRFTKSPAAITFDLSRRIIINSPLALNMIVKKIENGFFMLLFILVIGVR